MFAELTGICGAGNTSWRFEDQTRADEYVVDHVPAAAPPTPKPAA